MTRKTIVFLFLHILSNYLTVISYNQKYLETEYCKDKGECFSGAYMTTVSHIKEAPGMAFYFKNYINVILLYKCYY